MNPSIANVCSYRHELTALTVSRPATFAATVLYKYLSGVAWMTDGDMNFKGLFEAAPDAILGVDAGGRIVIVNAQTEELFGYARSELIGAPVELLVPPDARTAHSALRDSYFAAPVARPMNRGLELRARRKDGSEFPAEISLSAIETDKGPLVAAAVRDVSERVEAEAERERLGAQAERERSRGQDSPVPEAGEPRPARRWRRSRLQQPARRDHQLHRVHRRGSRRRERGARR